jgi:hypothetical protein
MASMPPPAMQLNASRRVPSPAVVKAFGLAPRAVQPKMALNLGAPRPGGIVIQRKILKNISAIDVGADERTISQGLYETKLVPFLYGTIAGHPNQTMNDLFTELDLDAYPNNHVQARVAVVKQEFWAWVDAIVQKTWGTVKTQWAAQDDKIEKLYMMCKGNKASIPLVSKPMIVSSQRNVEISQANADAWRARGIYGGLRSRIPNADKHYVVGRDTTQYDSPGAERLYAQNVRLTDGTDGIRAFYSSTHGDAKATHAVEESLVSNRTIGGRRVVAPWDPYLP